MGIKHILVTIVIATLVGGAVWLYKSDDVKFRYQFPYAEKLRDVNKLSCEAMISTLIYGSNNPVQERGVFGEMFKGTEKIAIQIEGDKMYLLTGTSAKVAVEAGSAKSENEPWTVTRNDKDYITGVYSVNGVVTGNQIDVVIIKKSNGMGVWTKTSDGLLGYDTPDAQTFYLKCQ